MKRYTARAERDEGGWWAVTVPELPGVFTQARRLDQVEELARDAIALWLEAPSRSFVISLEPSVPDLDKDIAETIRARRQAEELRDEATVRSCGLAAQLAARGLTVRDIGQLLGVSYQRAAQLLNRKTAPRSARAPRAPAKQRATTAAMISSRAATKKAARRAKPKEQRASR